MLYNELETMMNFLLDPNVAYLILLAGVMLVFLSLASPGTGIFEIGALFCILLTGYIVYYMSFNWWALLVLSLSVIPFIYSIQRPSRGLFLGLAILLLVVGSVFMFPSEDRFFGVNPLVAILASGLVAGFLWLVVSKSMEAASERPTHDLENLVGQIGEARTSVHTDGSVQVSGELWSAKSEETIPTGSAVRVLRRNGFVVIVEKVDNT